MTDICRTPPTAAPPRSTDVPELGSAAPAKPATAPSATTAPAPRTWRLALGLSLCTALALGVSAPAGAQEGDRRDRRSSELALPDEYLDPAWPDDLGASPVAPDESDSVERVPAPDEQADQAELEEMERYKEALGLKRGADDFAQDHWDEDKAVEPGVENDPAEW